MDAWFVLERAAGAERAALVRRLDEPVGARVVAYVDGMVDRRRRGEPLQYVLGRWGFRGLDLIVDRRVLIPRPETETVVEVAIGEARRLRARRPVVVDLGTGSGAIALSVAVEVPGSTVWATDRSDEALAVARANLAGVGSQVAPRVRLVAGSWFGALPDDLRGRVDLVVSNPPYIGAGEHLPPEVADWEPPGALVAGPRGIEAVAEIVAASVGWLSRPGALVVEVAPDQAEEAAALARGEGFDEVDVRPDLVGRPRALVGRLSG